VAALRATTLRWSNGSASTWVGVFETAPVRRASSTVVGGLIGKVGDDHVVDKRSRDPDAARCYRSTADRPLDLDDDDSPAVVGGLRNGEVVGHGSLVVHPDVAVRICLGCPQ
jgi:hypothetical protein